MTDTHACPVDRAIIPAVEVVLDRPRWLVEDFDAIEAFEDATGLNATNFDDLNEIVTGPDGKPTGMRSKLTGKQRVRWVWAHLRRDDPGITVDHVKHLMSQPRLFARVEQGMARLAVEASKMLADELADLGVEPDAGSEEGEGGGDPFDGREGDSTPSPGSTSA